MKIRKLSTAFLCTAVCAALLTGCGERKENSLSDGPDKAASSVVSSVPDTPDEASSASSGSAVSSDTSSSEKSENSASSNASSTKKSDNSAPVESSADNTSADETSNEVSSPAATDTSVPLTEQSSSPQSVTQPVESSVPEHQHQYSILENSGATCTEVGYEIYKCSCGDQYTKVTSEALGHSYSKSTLSPTCISAGYTTYTCARCGHSYTDDHTAALDHNYTSETVKATCTQNGYTIHTCSRCGNAYTTDSISATGHSWSDWTVTRNATVSSEGEKRSECTRCGETKTEAIEKLKDDSSTYVSEVVRLVNIEREKQGLSPLTMREDLNEYAQLRSTEIVSNFEHKRPDGASPLEYVLGLSGVRMAGENIAYGQKTPEAVVTAWMNSEGHRANILNAGYKSIGVGCYRSGNRLYWTQIFAG